MIALTLAFGAVFVVNFVGERRAAAPTPTPTGTGAASSPVRVGFGVDSPPPPAPVIPPANASTLAPTKMVLSLAAPALLWGIDQQLIVRGPQGVARFDPLLNPLSMNLVPQGTLLGIAPDGATVVRSGGSGATDARLEALGGTPGRSLAAGPIAGATFIKRGTAVALTSADRPRATLWDVATGTMTGELSGFTTAAPVYALRMAEDGSRAAWVSRGTVQFHTVAANTLGARLNFEDFVAASAFAPDGSRFVTSLPGPSSAGGAPPVGILEWWDPATGSESARSVDQTGPARTVAVSPDGRLVATANKAGVRLWTADGQTAVATLSIPNAVEVAFSLDGKILATATEEGSVTVWSAK